MATKKFSVEAYQVELRSTIASLKEELKSLEGKRDWTSYKRIRSLESDINQAELELDPHYLTEWMYSDRHAYEFIGWETQNRILVRQLKAKRIDNNGMSESQEYEFTQDESRPILTLRRHKNGCWYTAGGCTPFTFTARPYEYYDFSF